jgi:hypothetical protein
VADSAQLRNSRILGVLDQIIHDQDTTLRAVEIAGRGIAAEARCTLAVSAGKNDAMSALQAGEAPASAPDPLAAFDKLMELSQIEDDLIDLWQRRSADDLADGDFEAELRSIVSALEAWPEVHLE